MLKNIFNINLIWILIIGGVLNYKLIRRKMYTNKEQIIYYIKKEIYEH